MGEKVQLTKQLDLTLYTKQVLLCGVLSAIQKKTVRHTNSIAYHTYGNVWSIESLVWWL